MYNKLMISVHARLLMTILRLTHRSSQPTQDKIVRARSNYDRRLQWLAPTFHRGYMKAAGIPDVDAYWISPPTVSRKRTIIYLHGGGFVNGSTRAYLQHLIRTAKLCDARLLSIDYPLAPESPYPAALDTILDAWKYLVNDATFDPKSAIFMGESAGGSLALAAVLRIRDEKLPMPGATVLLSPALDMTLSGESITSRADRELILNNQKVNFYADMYAADSSRTLPYISPVLADLHDMPPMLVHVGTEEMLYSDSIRIAEHAKRDGVSCELYIGQGMWHGWHIAASVIPEAKRDMKAVATFVKTIR